MEVTYALGGAMVMLGGKTKSIEDGISLCRSVIQSGKAWDKFIQLVKTQGGDISYLHNTQKYPQCKYSKVIKSASAGDIDNIDALEVGFINIMLGGGRSKIDDKIDPKAGIVLYKKVGDSVDTGEKLAEIFTDRKEIIEIAAHRLEKAFSIATEPSVSSPLIHALIDEKGVHPWQIHV